MLNINTTNCKEVATKKWADLHGKFQRWKSKLWQLRSTRNVNCEVDKSWTSSLCREQRFLETDDRCEHMEAVQHAASSLNDMRLHKWKWCALWQEVHKYVLLSGGPWSSMDGSSIMFKRPEMPSSNVPSTTGVWSAPCCRPYWWLKRGYLRAKLLRLAGLPPTKCVLIPFDSQNFHPWQFRPSEWNTRW